MEDILTIPFDASEIFRKMKKMKKKFKEDNKIKVKIKIAVLGGSTTNAIIQVLDLFLLNQSIEAEFYESDYNQYYEDAIFGNIKLNEFKPDIIYIHTTIKNIKNLPSKNDSMEEVERKYNEEKQKLIDMWRSLKKKYNCIIIQNNFEYSEYRIMGNLERCDYRGNINFIDRLNIEISKYAKNNDNFYINDINYLSAKVGLAEWFDKNYWYSYKYALSYKCIPYLAHNLSNIIKALYGKTKKCIVVDLDNTLWGGVIGDDGVEKILLGQGSPEGEAYLEFQKYLKELKEIGVSLAVASKNELEKVKEGFSHPDSILKYDDFIEIKANWNRKSENIYEISKSINIGLDSIVFIDDNPFEREEVKKNYNVIKTPNIGEEVINYIKTIDNEGYFERINLSKEDIQRNKFYIDNKKREEEIKSYSNYGEFLNSLKMEAEIKNFKEIYLDRIIQLLNKTNQFNLNNKRYTKSEIEKIFKDEKYIKLYGRLEDKFGDNGLISVLIGKIIGKEIIEIESWVMSCRVFKRDMELAMFDKFVEEAKRIGIKTIKGDYILTKKNKILIDIFSDIGFKKNYKDESNLKIEYNIPSIYVNKNECILIKK